MYYLTRITDCKITQTLLFQEKHRTGCQQYLGFLVQSVLYPFGAKCQISVLCSVFKAIIRGILIKVSVSEYNNIDLTVTEL